jgi:serine/threonine protein kinase/Tol biopolymer transport system component
MGEVWRAEDTKLGRQVALKVLPGDVAGDRERLARFEREAKVLASLNHPNIATLYGLESVETAADETGTTLLVMELVDGDDLSDRIRRGAMPVGQAAAVALQIAEALEAAHEQGIVHRDLKPANVKIRPDGAVKVLDFGLAKAWESESADHSLSLSPTMTQHATAAGIILGTAGYMAPEQASGSAADRRADIWAFGVVLWEMLTGDKLFEGETVSHVLASVLKDEPDLDALPDDVPPTIVELIERCLRKNPKTRIQAMGDVRIALEEYLANPDTATASTGSDSASATSSVGWRRWLPWAACAALGVALILSVVFGLEKDRTVVKATIPPPEGRDFDLRAAAPGPAVVSPDGRRLAYTAVDEDGESRIFVRNLDASDAYALSGTEGAQFPFWAPDSRWLGFFTQPDDLLRKIDTTGGPPITLCPASNGKGGSWSPEGVIVFAPNAGSGIHQISSAGGEPVEITTRDLDRHNSHRLPWFLPDGRHFLFTARGINNDDSAVMIGSLDGDEPRELLRSLSQAAYAQGQLLFVRDNTLMTQGFDPEEMTLIDEAVPLAEEVLVIPGAALAVFGVSQNGVLAYQTGDAVAETILEWRDRSGRPTGVLGDPALYRVAALSPDDRYAAAQAVDPEGGAYDLWIYEIERNIRTRFTFDANGDVAPVWSPDGNQIYFASNRGGNFSVYRKPLSGVGEVELIHDLGSNSFPESASPDGRYLSVLTAGEGSGGDIHLIDLGDGNQAAPFRVTEFNEGGTAISPDGRWIAFHSDESGDFEVFVTTFPTAGRKWQISTANGVYPDWRADGREIVYSDFAGNLVSVEVDGSGESFDVGPSETLFLNESPEQGGPHFSIAADAERFLVVPGVTQQADTLLHLVVNWPVQIEARR